MKLYQEWIYSKLTVILFTHEGKECRLQSYITDYALCIFIFNIDSVQTKCFMLIVNLTEYIIT